MAGSTLPMTSTKRTAGVVAGIISIVALSGCGITSSSEGQSYTSAEAGIVTGVDYIARSFGMLAFEGDGAVTAEDLSTVVETVQLDPSTQSVKDRRRTEAIYGLTSDGATTSIRFFVPTAVQVNSGIYGESTDLFGCGVLRADPTTQMVTLADESCPDWILEWNGDDAEEISIEGALENQGMEPRW